MSCAETILSNLKNSIIYKTPSLENGREFVELLSLEKYKHLKFIQFTATPLVEATIDLSFKFTENTINFDKSHMMFQRVQPCINLLKETINRLKPSIAIEFFFIADDAIDYENTSVEILDFINNKIILLSNDTRIGELQISVLIPDYYICDLTDFNNTINSLKENNTAFKNRKPLAKFIGNQTGGMYNANTINTIPRLIAIHIGKNNKQLLDIKFNNYNCQSTPEFANYMKKTFGKEAPYEPMKALCNYKFLLSFDGNGSAWKRPEIIMHSKSIPLFQTRYEKFWTCCLVSGVNYIKINDDVSNLVSTVKHLKSNPELELSISEKAQNLATQILIPDFIKLYFTELVLLSTARFSFSIF